jgi:tRNA-dihydrouridine synthase B
MFDRGEDVLVKAVSIGAVTLASPFVVAPMAGMTDTAFRRLVKRQGGCGLVVSEMVSSEGLVRGIDRTLEYAEFTEEERPVSIQIFGGDPDKMAAAAQIVEGMGADIVDVNMGCPVPKIAKHHAGCSLMREPEHAADVVRAMSRAVNIPVTVKMRAGWSESNRNAPELARRLADAGAAAISLHGRTAEQSYRGLADWELVARVASDAQIPVLGSGDCMEPEDIVRRMQSGVSGVLVGRGVLRNPWILAQALDLSMGRPARSISLGERGRFLREYMTMLLAERGDECAGFRHVPPGHRDLEHGPAHGRERWVINKLRALCSWYSKGLDGGSRLRIDVNAAESVSRLSGVVDEFFSTVGGRESLDRETLGAPAQ